MLSTSNCKFEARGCTIIAIQDSQDEISGLTSKFRNPPLDTLNCNDKFGTFSSCCTDSKAFVKRETLSPTNTFPTISGCFSCLEKKFCSWTSGASQHTMNALN